MSTDDQPNFKVEYMLWMTDRDLACLISHIGDRTLHEAFQLCDPLVRWRVLAQISDIRKDHFLYGGPWNKKTTEETIRAAQKYIGQVADQLHESGEIGYHFQRYIA